MNTFDLDALERHEAVTLFGENLISKLDNAACEGHEVLDRNWITHECGLRIPGYLLVAIYYKKIDDESEEWGTAHHYQAYKL